MKISDTIVKLLTYDVYSSVCEILEVKPLSFGDYIKRVIKETKKK